MQRLVTAVVISAILLSSLWLLPAWTFLVLTSLFAALAAGELAVMGSKVGATVPVVVVSACAVALNLSFLLSSQAGTGLSDLWATALLGLVVFAGLLTVVQSPVEPATLTRAALLVFAPIYVGLPLGAIGWVHLAGGPGATTWLIAMIATSDSAQYYSGRAFGRRKLAPSISPAKTVEGAIGGLAGAAVMGALLGRVCLPMVPAPVAALLAFVLACCGIVGDLFESLIKRSVGVKDSSALIPGHGGVLDRIDSHLFATPAFYIFLRYFAS